MAVKKHAKKSEVPHGRDERVSLSPLDPAMALRGLLATPAPEKKQVKRAKSKRPKKA